MAYEFLFANNATTTLAESVSATATVLNVSSGDGALFPSPSTGQAFAVTLVDAATGLTNEICYCTSRSGDALTVVRGQEGKNALAWSAGDTCANYITADVMESWLQESDLSGYATEAWVESNTLPSQSVFGQVSQIYYTPTPNASSSTSHTITLTFSAPRDGLVYATGSFNVSNIQPSQCTGTLEIGGSSYQPTSGASVWSDTTLFPMSGSGVMRVKKGDSISIISTYGLPPSSSTFAAVGQTLTYSFVPSGF